MQISLEVLNLLNNEIQIQSEQITSKNLVSSLFAFDQNESISHEHSDTLKVIYLLEGTLQITTNMQTFTVNTNQFQIIPEFISHSLLAITPCKFIQVSLGGKNDDLY